MFVEHIFAADLTVCVDGRFADVADIAKAVVADVDWPRHARMAVECRRASDALSGRHAWASYATRDIEVATGTVLEGEGAVIDLEKRRIQNRWCTGRSRGKLRVWPPETRKSLSLAGT